MKRTHYILGFVFDASLEQVLLIHKKRPAWQKGRINGLGGHIEENESPVEAIMREVKEECGITVTRGIWKKIGIIESRISKCFVFTAIYREKLSDIQTKTDEKVQWYKINKLPKRIVSNLTWFIPLCRDIFLNKDIIDIDFKIIYQKLS